MHLARCSAFYLLGLSFFLVGCATTSVDSLRNPDVQISSLRKIVIYGQLQDIGWKKSIENAFVEELVSAGIEAIQSTVLLSPFKTYSPEDVKVILDSSGIDGVMFVTLVDSYNDKAYIPPTSTTTGKATMYGNTIYGQSITTTTGGYYVSKPRVKFEVVVYQAKTGVIAWKATTFTAGNAFANTNTLFKSLASKIVTDFIEQP